MGDEAKSFLGGEMDLKYSLDYNFMTFEGNSA